MPGRSPHIAGSPSTYLRAGNLRGASPPPTNTTSALRHAQSRRRRPRSPPPDRRSRHQGGSIPMSTSGSIPVSAKVLPEQRTYPLLDVPKRRRLRPRSPNHGCPWIQKSSEKATVMLGSVPNYLTVILSYRLIRHERGGDARTFVLAERQAVGSDR